MLKAIREDIERIEIGNRIRVRTHLGDWGDPGEVTSINSDGFHILRPGGTTYFLFRDDLERLMRNYDAQILNY